MNYRCLSHLFSIFGTLSVKINSEILEVSRFHFIQNCLKVFFFSFFTGNIAENLQKYNSGCYKLLRVTPFFMKFFMLSGYLPLVFPTALVLVQLGLSTQNVLLVRRFIAFRMKMVEMFSPAKNVYKTSDKKTRRILYGISAVQLFSFVFDFFLTMQISLRSFLVFGSFCFLHTIPIFFVSYVFVIIRLIICSQKILHQTLAELKGKPLNDDTKSIIHQILLMRSELSILNREMVRYLSVPLFIALIYFISHIISQVSLPGFSVLFNAVIQIFQLYYFFILVLVEQEIDTSLLLLSTVCYIFPMAYLNFFCILLRAEQVQQEDQNLVRMASELHNSQYISPLLIQITQQPLQLTIFECISLSKLTITYLVSEISSWFIMLIQFDLSAEFDD